MINGVDRHAPATRHGRQAGATAGVHEQRSRDGDGAQRDRQRADRPQRGEGQERAEDERARQRPSEGRQVGDPEEPRPWTRPRRRAHSRAMAPSHHAPTTPSASTTPPPPGSTRTTRIAAASVATTTATRSERAPALGPRRDGVRKARHRDQGRRQDDREGGQVQGALDVLLLLDQGRGQRRRAGQDQHQAQHHHEEPDREGHRERERRAEGGRAVLFGAPTQQAPEPMCQPPCRGGYPPARAVPVSRDLPLESRNGRFGPAGSPPWPDRAHATAGPARGAAGPARERCPLRKPVVGIRRARAATVAARPGWPWRRVYPRRLRIPLIGSARALVCRLTTTMS